MHTILSYFKSKKSELNFKQDVDLEELLDISDRKEYDEIEFEYMHLVSSDAQMKYFLIGYYFAIDNSLNRIASIQRRISTHGADEFFFGIFEEKLSQKKDDKYLGNLFNEVMEENITDFEDYKFKSFLKGYKAGEDKSVALCQKVTFTSKLYGIELHTAYTVYWEMVSKELFSMPEEFSVKNFVDRFH